MPRKSLPHRAEAIREAFVVMLGIQLTLGFIGFLTSTVAARLLGPTGRGELAAVWSVPNLLAVLSGLGMGEASLYFAAKQPAASRRIVAESLRISCYGAAGMTLVGFFALQFLIEDPTTRLSAQLSMPVTFAVSVFAVCHQPLRGLGYSRLWGGFRASNAGSWLVILIVASLIGYRNIRGLALTYVGAQLAIAAYSTRLVRRYDSDEVPRWPQFQRRLLAYGLPSSLITAPYLLNARLDQVLMITLVDRSDLGIYTAAVSFSLLAGFPFQALAKVTMPRIAGHAESWRQTALQVIGTSLALVVVTLLIGIPVTGWLFPALMGEGFADGVVAARLLIIAATIRGTADVLQETLRGLGTPTRAAIIEALGLVVGITTLLLLVGRHGIVGAAIASILGYGTALIGHGLLVGRAFLESRPNPSDVEGNNPGPASQ